MATSRLLTPGNAGHRAGAIFRGGLGVNRRALLLLAAAPLAAAPLASPALAQAPALDWAARIGAQAAETALAAATDASGAIVLAGSFSLTVDFDPGPGVHELTGSVTDPFLARYASDGSLLWADAFVGVNNADLATAVAARGDAVFVCGDFVSPALDMDPGPGTFELPPSPTTGPDAFVGRYAAADGALVWAFSIGGSGGVVQFSRATLDAAGDLLVAGLLLGTVDFDPGPGSAPLTAGIGTDVFFAKYDADGDLVWARSLRQIATSASGTPDGVGGLAVDPADDSFVLVGTLNGTIDFDPGAGTSLLTGSGGTDPFLARYDAGGDLVWAHALASEGNANLALGAGLGAAGEIFVLGMISGETDFDPDPVATAPRSGPGGLDLFLARYTPSGEFVWAEAFGGLGTDRPFDLRVAPNGEITISGTYNAQPDLDPGPGTFPLPAPADQNGFVARYEPGAGALLSAGALEQVNGNSGVSEARLAHGPTAGDVVVGYFSNQADFDPGPGLAVLESAGAADAFLVRLDGSSTLFADGFESGDTSAWSSVVP
jgi:hypothetical protein